MESTDSEVLDIRDLHVSFTTSDGVVDAVKGVDVSVGPGECLGVVGESGSGKSQTFLAAMGLLAQNAQVRGQVRFAGQDLLQLNVRELNRIRGSRISMIFQDPLTALTPHLRIGDQMREVLQTHQGLSNRDAQRACLRWLDNVRIPEAAQRLIQYPHELSGGMQLRGFRQDAQIVFQDPLASLNPSMTIGDSIVEPLRVFEPGLDRIARTRRVAAMMERVGLPYTLINRYPHELSGGQNQRVGIARAMMCKPKLLICDEAVSALDVSIQAQITELLKDLQREFGMSLIFISHDLSVVWEVSTRVLVMYLGSVVELASRDELFARPQHPYTRQLVSAVPVPDPRIERSRQRIKLVGEMASPMDTGARLRFLASRRDQLPKVYIPLLSERFPGHFVAEHDPLDSLLRD